MNMKLTTDQRNSLRRRAKAVLDEPELATVAAVEVWTAIDRLLDDLGEAERSKEAMAAVPLWQSRSNPFSAEGELRQHCLGCDRMPNQGHVEDCWAEAIRAAL